ncbi:MAG: hypothetical protein F4Z28_10445 [Gammaproteobacteria bacterium]|nr:hypothetical protein [Gammaproteobacteria bacterium]
MMKGLASSHGTQVHRSARRSWAGDVARPATRGWYGDASGGFILETRDAWNPALASLVFPRITSSSRIDRRYVVQFVVNWSDASTLPVARQVRELQAALSLNKSELARVLRVTRPTVYDWLDGGEPNVDNVARIGQLLRLVSQARVSSRNPLFPRFVRSPLDAGGPALLDLLGEETIGEPAVRDAIQRAKGLGDALDTRRRRREARLRAAGFEEPDEKTRAGNLETSVALKPWPAD